MSNTDVRFSGIFYPEGFLSVVIRIRFLLSPQLITLNQPGLIKNTFSVLAESRLSAWYLPVSGRKRLFCYLSGLQSCFFEKLPILFQLLGRHFHFQAGFRTFECLFFYGFKLCWLDRYLAEFPASAKRILLDRLQAGFRCLSDGNCCNLIAAGK